MSKIRIVNWLLTRKCNLKCDYCAIVKNYPEMPEGYPRMGHYVKNEMTTLTILDALSNFKKHNPEVFHIFYGGEPLLRKDLAEIINYCNQNEIYYTIISNNTEEIQPLIEKLFQDTKYIAGFTSSVDPSIFSSAKYMEHEKMDRITKSIEGLKRLKEFQKQSKVKDVVAEITVMNDNQHLLKDLVTELSKHDIYSDITFVDIAKNDYYDFSNVTNEEMLVKPTFGLATTFKEMLDDPNLLIHMKDVLLPTMFDTLPSNFNCELEKGIHNVTVDADGTMRLCLRIRGELTPHVHVRRLFEEKTSLVTDEYFQLLKIDKKNLCQGCNHSCLMMSKYIDKKENDVGSLVHSDKREV